MKEILIKKMKDVFDDDSKRIDHALAVLDFAERIQAVEGGDPVIIIAAAILHDIGIHKAEKKYGSTAGKFQEIEGPSVARPILKDCGIPPSKIERIYRIIANHHTAKDNKTVGTIEFRVIWDADWLVNVPDECEKMSKDKLKQFVEKIFKTNKGKQLAEEMYLRNDKYINEILRR